MHINPVQRSRRKPSLTPMIDVVFLLLVFFMLASRFGLNRAIPIPLATGGGDYTGPPRLIDVLPETVLLNGIMVELDQLAKAVGNLTEKQTDTVILRGKQDANLQRIVDISATLKQAGFESLVLVE